MSFMQIYKLILAAIACCIFYQQAQRRSLEAMLYWELVTFYWVINAFR